MYGRIDDAQEAWHAMPQRTDLIFSKAFYYAIKCGPMGSKEDIVLWLLRELSDANVCLKIGMDGAPKEIREAGLFTFLIDSPIGESRRVVQTVLEMRLPPHSQSSLHDMLSLLPYHGHDQSSKSKVDNRPHYLSATKLFEIGGKELVQLAAKQGYYLAFLRNKEGESDFEEMMDKDTIISVPTKDAQAELVRGIVHFALALGWKGVLAHILKTWPNLKVYSWDVKAAEDLGWTDFVEGLASRVSHPSLWDIQEFLSRRPWNPDILNALATTHPELMAFFFEDFLWQVTKPVWGPFDQSITVNTDTCTATCRFGDLTKGIHGHCTRAYAA